MIFKNHAATNAPSPPPNPSHTKPDFSANKIRLYATDLADLVFCPRLFFMKKTNMAPRTENFPMLKGTIEHEIRRTLTKSIKSEYESCKNLNDLKNLDLLSNIDGALDYGLELGKKVKAEYYLRLQDIMPTLRYRLKIEEERRLSNALKLGTKNQKIENIIEKLLPWKVETGVGSTELAITGRLDQVFKIGKNLIPLDFKTHSGRFSAFLMKDSHHEQLSVYGVLLEMKYPGFKVKEGIISYTEDLHEEKFNITKKSKSDVLEHIVEAKKLINKHLLPPKLSGEKSVNCHGCYMRQFCFSLDDGDENNC